MTAARVLAAALLAAAALGQAAVPASALVDLWTITASPLAMEANKDTTVQFEVTNLGILTDTLGCVEVSIPGAFDLKEVKLVSAPSGSHWKTGSSGGSGSTQTAEYRVEHDGDELTGGQTAVFRVKVRAASAGAFTWTARAWSDRGCDSGEFLPAPLAIVVGPDLSPTPTPSPTPRPTPTPTPRPTATTTPTPRPTATPTPRPTPTPILGLPLPLPLPSLGLPKPTPTPTPATRPTPTPSPTSTPTPAASAEPSPTSTPSGTGTPAPSPSGRDAPAGSPATVAANSGTEGPAGSGGGSTSRWRVGSETDGPGATGPEIEVSLAAVNGLGSLTWAVPSLVLAVPGLLLVLAVVAQAVGGILWLPVIRRRIGGFGLTRRRRTDDGHNETADAGRPLRHPPLKRS